MGRTIRVESSRKADVRAPHLRERIWIVADSNGIRRNASRRARSDKEWIALESKGLVSPDNEAPIFTRDEASTIKKCKILGVCDDVSGQLDRIKSLGNAQVPQCAAEAWRILSE